MRKLKKASKSIIKRLLSAYPDLLSEFVETHRNNISRKISSLHNYTVAHGPFKGMHLTQGAHWGSNDKGAMILGLYEKEILQELIGLTKRYDIFIDLGAADGYYCIGMLINEMAKKSYCYEITKAGREIIQENAKINGVSDKVIIRGEARNGFSEEIPIEEIERSVLLVDIEGGEFDLLDKKAFLDFKKSVIFVELHDWFFKDGELKLDKLIAASKDTHKHKYIKMGQRDLSALPEVEKWNDSDRWLLCSEGRAQLMSWLRFDPIDGFV